MKSQSVIAAFRYFLRGEREQAITIMRQIEANETRTGNTNISRQIRSLLDSMPRAMKVLPNKPDGGVLYESERTLDSLILTSTVRVEVTRILREWECRDSLEGHGIAPRSTMLLHGPSGNGKTALAEAMANSLGLPVCIADYASLIDSYRGATAGHLAKLFDSAASSPCVLLFDEADSLVSRRGKADSVSGMEDNRTVNDVLIRLDRFPSTSLVIFATNMPAQLDSALKRRISICLELPSPTPAQLRTFAVMTAKRFPFLLPEAIEVAVLAESFAECESRILDAARIALCA